MMTVIRVMMMIESMKCVKPRAGGFDCTLLRHLFMHRRDVPPVRHQTLRKSECDIFPDRDQLCLSERAFGPLQRLESS